MINTKMIGNRIHTYSDARMMIRQVETGIIYDSAVDVPGKYTYIETDIPIQSQEITAEEALNIITGGDVNDPDRSH